MKAGTNAGNLAGKATCAPSSSFIDAMRGTNGDAFRKNLPNRLKLPISPHEAQLVRAFLHHVAQGFASTERIPDKIVLCSFISHHERYPSSDPITGVRSH